MKGRNRKGKPCNCIWFRRALDILLPLIIIALLFYLALESNHSGEIVIDAHLYTSVPLKNDAASTNGYREEHISTGLIRDSDWISLYNKSNFVYRELFRNITKTRNQLQLFHEVPEDVHLLTNITYFTMNSTVNDHIHYNTFIDGGSICLRNKPFVLILIPSQIAHRDLREAVRRTWLKSAQTNNWPNFNITKSIKHVFLFGYRPKAKVDDVSHLQAESTEHGDIVMADFVDTYRNLTLKILIGIEWTLKHCSGVEFLLKVDEDTLVNVPLMVELLTHVHTVRKNETFVLGLMHANPQPVVARKGRWKVSEVDYPLMYYPRYLYGHTYAMSGSSLSVILDSAKRVARVAPEDAFFTGILPKFAGITRLTAPSFTVCCRKMYDCELVWNSRVAMTSVRSTGQLNRLWAHVLLNKCNNMEPMSVILEEV